MSKANLYIIAAPSGAGKTSLVKALVQKMPNLKVSVSYTTRKPRPGDREGIDYHFIKSQEFEAMIQHNAFLEYAKVHGNYYGTSRAWIEQAISQGTSVILEIDWQGAQQIRQLMSDAIAIFILPPSVATLRERLIRRQQDEAEVINQRLDAAKSEIKHYEEFDYLVVNDHFDSALHDLEAIIQANHPLQSEPNDSAAKKRVRDLLCIKQSCIHAELIRKLLAAT